MSCRVVRAAGAALLLAVLAGTLPAAHADALDEYRWRHRVLVIFVPVQAPPEMLGQVNATLAEHAAQCADRDLVTLLVRGDEVRVPGSVRPDRPADLDGPDGQGVDALPAAELLRERFAPPPAQLAVVLIGKDGGVKAYQRDALELDELFALIDGMPMRREEMRRDAAAAQPGKE